MESLFDVGSFLDTFSASSRKDAGDLFSSQRKAWHKADPSVARCDFAPDRAAMSGYGFKVFTLWRRSIYGRTLHEIKESRDMRPFFAHAMIPFITSILGRHLPDGGWAIITPPPRRHTVDNFAQDVARRIADGLSIPFHRDVAAARSRGRIGVEFDLLNLPPQPNIIVFDDIITTGATFMTMRRMLKPHGRNLLFVAAIKNS